MRTERMIHIRGAREHNLRDLELRIPHRRLVVVTGVSGSGKSSLVFDTLYREGQRRFLELLPSFSRHFAGTFRRPEVTAIDGLGPAIAVDQTVRHANPRSTVGTLTEVWDLLRLLFARLGDAPTGVEPSRGLFSFNGEGACPACRGLGVEDALDPARIIGDPQRSIRDGALRVSTPNGYLMYSQVTLAVLDEVLRAHGGSVDLPWNELSEEARRVVFLGSDRLLVPYGKHPLENRLKWTGITARPRQEGYYRGLLPVMEEILRAKRNDSILRYVRTQPCSQCAGTRLRAEARAVRWRDRSIDQWARLTALELDASLAVEADPHPALAPIREGLRARCGLMAELGLGYLSFDRDAPSLSPGEAQRLRLLSLALGELRGLLVVLDEPSAGLHPQEVARLVGVLRRMRDRGQTVVVVDHDPTLAQAADWLIDLGPGPGDEGGRLLWNGPPAALQGDASFDSPTRRWLFGPAGETPPPSRLPSARPAGTPAPTPLRLEGLSRHNVRDAIFTLHRERLNLITGLSGAGKTSLLTAVLERLQDAGSFRRIVSVDAEPIGRTPRSNPATYSGAFDPLRDLFAATAEARSRGLTKGDFSFNTAGGRCEKCEGAGVLEIGMRYLGSVELTCDACDGRRFHPDVLAVRLDGCSIADLLELRLDEVERRFSHHRKLARILRPLVELGLGYLPLGQPATTLSGGEARRIKLATELARASVPSLIALDEPSTGLHAADVAILVRACARLCASGHTLLVADHDPDLLRAAEFVTEMGPGSGPAGGRVVFAGSRDAMGGPGGSPTDDAGRGTPPPPSAGPLPEDPEPAMRLRGVTTHNLRAIDVEFPAAALTVVVGPSGSGKSSLVFDTLLAESQSRFADLVSPWARRFLPQRGGAELADASGLTAAVAVPAEASRRNPRATVGTATEVESLLRLLFARGGIRPCPACDRPVGLERCACGAEPEPLWAVDFSPQSERGACPECRGLGFLQVCDPDLLIRHPDRPLHGGALDGTRYGAFLGEADGRHLAVLRAAAAARGCEVDSAWQALTPEARRLALEGAGDEEFEVAWSFRRGNRYGVHRLRSPWIGLARLVEIEYERTHADERGEELASLLIDRPCAACEGERLRPLPRRVRYAGRRMPEVAELEIDQLLDWLGAAERAETEGPTRSSPAGALAPVCEALRRRLQALQDSGLGYLTPRRELSSLSGGEAQRVRLAAALSGGLCGVTYLLDEPTQGLHPRDTRRLINLLQALARQGNSVVVVEHDPEVVAAADLVIELGPGAGPDGGRLQGVGRPEALRLEPGSYTARLLAHPTGRRPPPARLPEPGVILRGAHRQTLRDLDVPFCRNALNVIAGVSGSGKSTLLTEVLAPTLRAQLRGAPPVGCREVECRLPLTSVLSSEQDSSTLAAGSSVGALLGLAEPIRRRYAATAEAKRRGLRAKDFSTHGPGGRCEECAGRGFVTIEMDFLPDVVAGCDRCGGRRFTDRVLGCTLDGLAIDQLLHLPLQELWERFRQDRALEPRLRAAIAVGLGYLRLGQAGPAVSSGERQRLRLAPLLAETGGGTTAVLLDEPTRGLGFAEVERLVEALSALVDAGHLVVVVEHHAALRQAADWLIELGPEGGAAGGRLLHAGPPTVSAVGAEDRPR